MKKVQRNFLLGDEWLYYKIYSGTKTSEDILINIVQPLSKKLLNEKIIDKWFFINYADPDRHVRVRFHIVKENGGLEYVVKLFRNAIYPLIENKLIVKIQVDTYKRELERYGYQVIEEFETLFHLNSELILDIINIIDGNPNKRWLFALKSLDILLSGWGMTINDKKNLFEFLKTSFDEEMGVTSPVRKILGKKYRKYREQILEVLQNKNHELNRRLLNHNNDAHSVIQQIFKKANYTKLDDAINVIDSYVHMHCNRIFTSRQRMNEWIVYDFLYNYYRSEIAKKKNKKSL